MPPARNVISICAPTTFAIPTLKTSSLAERAAPTFERNGFVLDTAWCERHRSGIGKGVYIYQWCRVSSR